MEKNLKKKKWNVVYDGWRMRIENQKNFKHYKVHIAKRMEGPSRPEISKDKQIKQ